MMGGLVQHLPWLRIVAALVGWVVLPGGASAPSTAQPPDVVALELVEGQTLSAGYRLAVVDVPPPPAWSGEAAPAPARGAAPELTRAIDSSLCPEITAIVVADDDDDTFALIDGTLARQGMGLPLGGRLASVESIEDGVVKLRVGTGVVRCGLE